MSCKLTQVEVYIGTQTVKIALKEIKYKNPYGTQSKICKHETEEQCIILKHYLSLSLVTVLVS